MEELIAFIAKSLVEKPENVTVSSEEKEDGSTLIKLSVDPGDMGRIIGKEGRTAKAMHTLLNAKATREGRRSSLQILE